MKTFLFCISAILISNISFACTNFIVTKGASEDGSTMVSYSADSHWLYGELAFYPAATYPEGTMRNVYDWENGTFYGRIKEAKQTYKVVGNMNEFQLTIAETTFGGRKELKNKKGIIDYGSLIYITLQRSKTAKEAIATIDKLVSEYGYNSSGESFSIVDPNEAWIMEIIGKGEGVNGANWVALKIPDGYVSGHANQSRIRKFPLNDPNNCLYSKDIIAFAKEKGYFKGNDADFSFVDAFHPLTFDGLRFGEARVWSGFNRIAPSLKLATNYVEGDINAEPLPLWVKPDKKLSVKDVLNLMRDHFEGTMFDMTKDIGAGPYKLPYRWRPLTWTVDSTEYFNERAIATQQTAFTFVSQCRSWLPNAIGGVHWFSVDDAYSTCFIPIYCGVNSVPDCFTTKKGSFTSFSWESAFWVFNFVSNYCYLRYSDMIQDVQVVQNKFEGKYMAEQKSIDDAAVYLYKQSPKLASDYLTNYCLTEADILVKEWKKLGESLIFKYLDGNIKNEKSAPTFKGYPEDWYKKVANETGDKLKVKK